MCAVKDINTMSKNGMRAMQDGNYLNAEFMMHQALRCAEQLGVDMYTAKLKNNLGIILNVQGKNKEAAKYFGDALEAIEHKLGQDNKLYRVVEANLVDAQKHVQ